MTPLARCQDYSAGEGPKHLVLCGRRANRSGLAISRSDPDFLPSHRLVNSKKDEEDVMRTPNVLMMGYNGANNTGAEALLLADIEDVRAVFGPDAHITVPTINPANLRRYLVEGPTLH